MGKKKFVCGLKIMEKEIVQIQLALFFQTDFIGSFEDFSLKLKTKLGESKITQHFPVPTDAPSEIPRLILGYENFNINVSKRRLDLFFKDVEPIKTIIFDISNVVLKEFALLVGRIGFIKVFFISKNIEYLKKLLAPKVANLDLKEINIRVNERKTIEGYDCNDIENLNIGSVIKKEDTGSETKREGIIVTRDINTLAEKLKENQFSQDKIKELTDVFNKRSDNFIIYSNDPINV